MSRIRFLIGIRRTPQVEADLDDIWYYVAVKNASIEVADRVVDSIAERFFTIARHPHIGRARDHDLRPGLRTFGAGEYLIVYGIDGEDAVILRVVRGSRDLPSLSETYRGDIYAIKESMPLEEYIAKRTFSNTPEPAPSKKEPKFAGNYFCVQRHDATRLHYDFRLEIDGVLKSWAVPKGPSLDPGVKHLAAHVEDHPVGYGDFEGNIPAGNYGAGSVMLWDRGTFELLGDMAGDAQIAKGDLKFRLHGEKLNGDFALVLMKGRGKGNEWLIIKKRDEFAAPGWDIESVAYSALSGRTQEEIARNLPAKKAKRKTAGAADRVWSSSRPANRSAAPKSAAKPAAKAAPKKKLQSTSKA